MFHISETRVGRGFQFLIFSLGALSVVTLAVAIWILVDVRHEQRIVAELIHRSTPDELVAISELAGNLRWQFWLASLLIVEAIVAGVARFFLVRAYIGSARSLREVKVLATDILASMDQGVITTDQTGLITSINPCGRMLLGGDLFSNSNWIGRRLREMDDRFAPLEEISRQVLTDDTVVRDQDRTVEIGGHPRILRCGGTPLRNEHSDKLGAVLQIRDVTEQKLIEERMLRMERHLELGTLAAGLQHEIKNPLSALSLHVQLLGEHLTGKHATPEVVETLSVLQTEMARITCVLQGFRNYADISEPGCSKVDPSRLITKLVRLVLPQAEQQKVQVVVDLPAPPLVLVDLDSNRFEQVLLNLTANALQAMPSGGTLSISLRQTADQMQVKVSDTGKGIPKDIQKRIFDPYFTTHTGGTGLGLALCEKIVRQHSGSIELQSSSKGSTFTISIPIECAV